MSYTLVSAFYGTERIIEYMLQLSKGSLEGWRQDAVTHAEAFVKHMDDEISSNMMSTIEVRQTMMFETLKNYYDLDGFNEIAYDYVLDVIQNYNNRLEIEFIKIVQEKEEEFINSPNYYREHGEEYEEIQNLGFEYKTKKIHRKFFCLETTPQFIDLAVFPKYKDILEKTVGVFIGVLKRYVPLYLGGKIGNSSQQTLPAPQLALPQSTTAEKKRINVKLSVNELACLFRLLFEGDVFKDAIKTEVFDFVSEHFITPQKGGKSAKKLMNESTNITQKTIEFWTRKLIEMEKNLKKC